NPDQPWMWRDDWAANSIREHGGLMVGALWLFAIVWNLISFPILFAVPFENVREKPVVAIVFLFPIVGVVLLIAALYQSARRAKYGASICHVDRVPIVPGRVFHGEIQTRVRDMPANGFQIHLSCVRRLTSG